MNERPIATFEDLLKLGYSRKQLGVNNKYHRPVKRTVQLGYKEIGNNLIEASDGTRYARLEGGTLVSLREKLSKAEKKQQKKRRTNP